MVRGYLVLTGAYDKGLSNLALTGDYKEVISQAYRGEVS